MTNKDYIFAELNECDTTYEFAQIYRLIKHLIDCGVSIKEIDYRCPKLTSYTIIDYLIRYGYDNLINLQAIRNYYNNLRINQDRCLIIADNHMGRLAPNEKYSNNQIFENERGLYHAYNHADKKGINSVIHLGDILEGDSFPDQYRIQSNPYQFEYYKKAYPYLSNIKTYLIYGNHDYHLIFFGNANEKFYKLCPNIELIGVNYSYINFCGHIVKLSHYCKQSSHINNLFLPYEFELYGHSHMYSIDEENRLVGAPTLSSLAPNKDGIGYLEMINEEKEFLFKFYDQNGNEIGNREKTLIKNTSI